jgi:hypothetical protein
VNIASSEQRHMDAVDRLIQAFGLTDTTPDEAGKFSIPELEVLYGELMAQGNPSLAEALAVASACSSRRPTSRTWTKPWRPPRTRP